MRRLSFGFELVGVVFAVATLTAACTCNERSEIWSIGVGGPQWATSPDWNGTLAANPDFQARVSLGPAEEVADDFLELWRGDQQLTLDVVRSTQIATVCESKEVAFIPEVELEPGTYTLVHRLDDFPGAPLGGDLAEGSFQDDRALVLTIDVTERPEPESPSP